MGYLLNISKEKLTNLKIIAAKEGITMRELLERQVDTIIIKHSN